ncbi:MAG: AraC family transcriptional regulator [Myxococcota bacterium]
MRLEGHADAKYATGTRLDSSASRGWPSLLAERWRQGQGRLNDIKPKETEIAVLLAGRGRVRRRGGGGRIQECAAVPGTVWLCPAGIPESDIEVFQDLEKVIHLFVAPRPFDDASLQEYDIDPAKATLRYVGGFQDAFVQQIAQCIDREMHCPSAAGGLLVDTLRAALCAHVLKQYSSLSPEKLAARAPRANGALDPARLRRVLEYMDAHLERNVALSELAQVACLSPYHFARSFKRATGAAPHQYLMGRRLDRAMQLIRQGHHGLAEIALKSGFSSQAHFARAFKRATGLTPTQYRVGE